MRCAGRIKAIEDTAYSGWMVNGSFEAIEHEDPYFKIAMLLEVLEDFME